MEMLINALGFRVRIRVGIGIKVSLGDEADFLINSFKLSKQKDY